LPPRSRQDLARVLLRRADGDLTLVRHVLDDADIPDAIIGFHAQQAVEKSLKAVLSAREVRYDRTHAIDYLVGIVEDNGIAAPASLVAAIELSPWAVEFRYADDDEPALDRHAVLGLVEEIRSWAGESVER
jgi:HEPN domain-containing protein